MRQAVNILFLGGAKRVSMARMFQASGERLGLDVNIFSYELSPEAPIAEVATVIPGRRWSDPELMEDLHNAVGENRIDIMVPFVDPAVEVAARYCASDACCSTPGVDGEMASLLFDKVASDELFRQNGFPLPANALAGGVDGKVIAKPRCGSSSKGIMVLGHEDFQRMAGSEAAADYIFQEYVERREEYTVDCYVSRAGRLICAVPRRRMEVAGGEVTVTQTLHDAEMEHWCRRIVENLKLRGPVTIQFLREITIGAEGERFPGRLMLMEINPRLGGGAVCAVHAGADLPGFILGDWLERDLEECADWSVGVKICRYMQEVVFDNGKYRKQ